MYILRQFLIKLTLNNQQYTGNLCYLYVLSLQAASI